MPNKTIYLNTIKEFEGDVGVSVINSDEVAQKLQEAWKKDTTEAKLDYLAQYREIFRDVLTKWSDHEYSLALNARSEAMPNFKKCLLKTDETLKLCALSLIPELRENADVLSNMTFGVMNTTRLQTDFIITRRKYGGFQEPQKAMKKRRADAYDKYQKEWRNTSTRKITALIWDQESLRSMSQDEKIDYALALETYRNDANLPHPLDATEKDLMDDALLAWKEELGFDKNLPINESVVNQYFQYAVNLQNNEWIDREINDAITEFNATPNPAQQEIAKYKELERVTAELKRVSEQTVRTEITEEAAEAVGEFFTAEEEAKKAEKIALERKKEKEHTILNKGVTDDTAEMVGGFFMQEDLTQEIAEAPLRKERVFLQEKVTTFNKEYSLKINHHKLRTSVEQLSALMIKAREEKEQFLSKDNVVVIENGKTKCYSAKEYFKDLVDTANKKYAEEKSRIEAQREEAKKTHEKLVQTILFQSKDDEKQTLENLQKLKQDAEKGYNAKLAGFDKELAKAKRDLEEELSALQGGVVIEKNGNVVRRYKASQYYETHETQKEQYAYGEYQQMFSRVYKDACKNIKEQNYPKGKATDFSKIAKDVDNLFKSAMYISNVYDNEKNKEVIQKCSFGGFSAEQLASAVSKLEGDSWARNQTDEALWAKQSANAKHILEQWSRDMAANPKAKPIDLVKNTVDTKIAAYKKGEITRKEMLDYALAVDSQLQFLFDTRAKRVFSIKQYNRGKTMLRECLSALDVNDNALLRSEISKEYTRLGNFMSKEEAFKSIEKRMDHSLSFEDEKIALKGEHQIVHDREVAKKVETLENLKALGKVPFPIDELDERKTILHGEPRVKPIVPTNQVQHELRPNQ